MVSEFVVVVGFVVFAVFALLCVVRYGGGKGA